MTSSSNDLFDCFPRFCVFFVWFFFFRSVLPWSIGAYDCVGCTNRIHIQLRLCELFSCCRNQAVNNDRATAERTKMKLKANHIIFRAGETWNLIVWLICSERGLRSCDIWERIGPMLESERAHWNERQRHTVNANEQENQLFSNAEGSVE